MLPSCHHILSQVQVPARCAVQVQLICSVDLLHHTVIRSVFLASFFAALTCPWMNARVVPVVRVPSCARDPLFIRLVLHICTCTTELYYVLKNSTNHQHLLTGVIFRIHRGDGMVHAGLSRCRYVSDLMGLRVRVWCVCVLVLDVGPYFERQDAMN